MEQFNFADYVVISLVVGCVGLGIYKGFRRCTLGLAVWIFAIVFAYIFGKSAGEFFTFIPDPGIKQIVGTVILLIVFGLLGILLRSMIFPAYKMPEISKIDRLGGIFFGIFLSCLLIILYLMSAGKSITDKDWYKESSLLGHLSPIAKSLTEFIPKSFKDRLDAEMAQISNPDKKAVAPGVPVLPGAQLDPNSVDPVEP